MNKFLNGITLAIFFTFSFQCLGQGTLAGRKVTMINKTGKTLFVKINSTDYTLRPDARKAFTFPDIEKASVKYEGSILPYRSLDIKDIAKNLTAKNASSATVDLIGGTSGWQAKLDSSHAIYS